jgi:hypothetical protein
MGLTLDPGAQARLQRSVYHLKRTRGKRTRVLDRQNPRLAVCDGDEDSYEVGLDAPARELRCRTKTRLGALVFFKHIHGAIYIHADSLGGNSVGDKFF